MSLHAVAHGNALNIGTADHVIATMDPGAVRPGELINWIKRFTTTELDDKITQLEALLDPLEHAANPSKLEELKFQWKGEGGRTFQQRWQELIRYIDTEPLGRRHLLQQQINIMQQLRDDIQDMYDGCIEDINTHLSDFREAYAAALCSNTDSAVVGSIFVDAAAGAGVGSMFGPPGAAIGGAIGTAVGLVTGFQSANEERIKAVLDHGSMVQGLMDPTESTGSSLDLSGEGKDGESLESKPFEPDDDLVAEGWDEAMSGNWEPK